MGNFHGTLPSTVLIYKDTQIQVIASQLKFLCQYGDYYTITIFYDSNKTSCIPNVYSNNTLNLNKKFDQPFRNSSLVVSNHSILVTLLINTSYINDLV